MRDDTQNRCGETSAILVLPIETYLLRLIPYRFCMPPLISQGFALTASPRGSLCSDNPQFIKKDRLSAVLFSAQINRCAQS